MVAERDRGGPYRDAGDLVRRAPVGRDVLAQMVRAGALDPFSSDRRRLLWEIRLHRAPDPASWRWRSTPPRRRRCRHSRSGS